MISSRVLFYKLAEMALDAFFNSLESGFRVVQEEFGKRVNVSRLALGDTFRCIVAREIDSWDVIYEYSIFHNCSVIKIYDVIGALISYDFEEEIDSGYSYITFRINPAVPLSEWKPIALQLRREIENSDDEWSEGFASFSIRKERFERYKSKIYPFILRNSESFSEDDIKNLRFYR